MGGRIETLRSPHSARARFLIAPCRTAPKSHAERLRHRPEELVTYACRSAIARGRRGTLNQLQLSFPRLPGIIPVALSAGFSCPRHLDCSIKERGHRGAACQRSHDFVLHKLLTREPVNNLAANLSTGCSRRRGRAGEPGLRRPALCLIAWRGSASHPRHAESRAAHL